MNEHIIEKAAEIIKKRSKVPSFCDLSLIDLEGYPTTSVITNADSEGIETLYFCTELNSNKVRRIEKCNKAAVSFPDLDYNITLVGTIGISTDPELKKEKWYPGLEHTFKGVDDPNYCVLIFKTRRYNLLVDWQQAEGYLY